MSRTQDLTLAGSHREFMTMPLHQTTPEKLTMLLQVPPRDVRRQTGHASPSIRYVPVAPEDACANEWSLVEILRLQNRGPDRAA